MTSPHAHLFARVADGGRGASLFGNAPVDAFCRACAATQAAVPQLRLRLFIFEFPLVGEPFVDVTLLVHGGGAQVEAGASASAGTAEAAPSASSEPLARLVRAAGFSARRVTCGAELDLSREGVSGGFHIDGADDAAWRTRALEALGQGRRGGMLAQLCDNTPEGWEAYVLGVFTLRAQAPAQVEYRLGAPALDRYRRDVSAFAADLERLGIPFPDDGALATLAELVELGVPLNLAVNQAADGRPLPKLSLLPQLFSAEAAARRRIGAWLQDRGLADGRWELAFERFVRPLQEDGDRADARQPMVAVRPRCVKIAWMDGEIQPAKCYLATRIVTRADLLLSRLAALT